MLAQHVCRTQATTEVLQERFSIKTIFCIGDVHAPFQDNKAIDKLCDAIKKESPHYIVQVGDLYDFFSFSRFPKKPGAINAVDELEQAHEVALEFWRRIKSLAPRASLYQLLGNHCVRPLKLSVEKSPELYALVQKSWKELFKFKGVETLLDVRDDLVIENIVFEHGFYSKPGQHLRENMQSTVIGHTHRPWVHYEQIRNKLLWELNCGYVANPSHEALSYSRKRFVKWVQGYGLINSDGPRFIAF